jgi:hypothetical protein
MVVLVGEMRNEKKIVMGPQLRATLGCAYNNKRSLEK